MDSEQSYCIGRLYSNTNNRVYYEKVNPKTQKRYTTTIISAVDGAKTKKPQLAQTTSDILKPISSNRILRFTDVHGYGLRLKVT